jgi:hypothetical protein
MKMTRLVKAIKIEVSVCIIFFTTKMSITLSHEMFTSLSKSCQNEILQSFGNAAVNTVKDLLEVNPGVISATAFESAALTFGMPLVLPNYNRSEDTPEPLIEVPVIRVAPRYPMTKATDLYRIATLPEIHKICKEVDAGLFVSNSKGVSWSKGSKYHHMNWDVKRVFMEVKYLQPATSLQIDQALPTMDRYRVSAILRELRKQGMVIVS